MVNRQVAKLFGGIAELLEIQGENPFRIRAYRRAALNIENLTRDLSELGEDEIRSIPGIGRDLAEKIGEFLATGKIGAYEELQKKVPAGVIELMRVPGLGPKTASLLVEELGVKNLKGLEKLARSGGLRGLPGIQKKTEENILRGIEFLKKDAGRRPLGALLPTAEQIVRQVQEGAPVGRITIAGSIRRRKETVGDVDILATSKKPGKVMETFVSLPQVERVLMQGATRSSVMTEEGFQADLRVVDEDSFGAALQYFTGSVAHNVRLREMASRRGLKINEYGVFREKDDRKIGGRREEQIYKAVGLPWIPPELREDGGEIEAAREGSLPDLVDLSDIRGDLHVHTDWSDGHHDLETVAREAKKRGYSYVAVTDHTKGLGVAHGLDEARLKKQMKLIDGVNRKLRGFRILKGTEIDIRGDGRLDLADRILTGLDIVVASVHSGFRQSKEQITKRLLAAVRHPCVSVIAHPTGRLIGEREAYEVDMEAVLKEAAAHRVAMEINAYPLRLDLNEQHVRRARELGVPVVISSDMHALSQYDTMHYGVSIARRGWLGKKDVLNTLPAAQLLRRLKSCRDTGR